jgi:hypothetical protein
MSSQQFTQEYLDSVFFNWEDLAKMEETFFQGCKDIEEMSAFDFDANKIAEVIKCGFNLKDRCSAMKTNVVSIIYDLLRTDAGRLFLFQNKKFTNVAVMKAHELIFETYKRPNDKQAQHARKTMQKFLYESYEIITHHQQEEEEENDDTDDEENVDQEEEDRDVEADVFDERIRNGYEQEYDEERLDY